MEPRRPTDLSDDLRRVIRDAVVEEVNAQMPGIIQTIKAQVTEELHRTLHHGGLGEQAVFAAGRAMSPQPSIVDIDGVFRQCHQVLAGFLRACAQALRNMNLVFTPEQVKSITWDIATNHKDYRADFALLRQHGDAGTYVSKLRKKMDNDWHNWVCTPEKRDKDNAKARKPWTSVECDEAFEQLVRSHFELRRRARSPARLAERSVAEASALSSTILRMTEAKPLMQQHQQHVAAGITQSQAGVAHHSARPRSADVGTAAAMYPYDAATSQARKRARTDAAYPGPQQQSQQQHYLPAAAASMEQQAHHQVGHSLDARHAALPAASLGLQMTQHHQHPHPSAQQQQQQRPLTQPHPSGGRS